jgi:hypothetical protein
MATQAKMDSQNLRQSSLELLFAPRYTPVLRQKLIRHYNIKQAKCEIILTPWSRVLSEKLTVTHLANTFPLFTEPEGSSPCLQQPATGSYPEPVESIP